MKITLHSWDVQEAVEEYIAQQFGANTERFHVSEMYFEHRAYTHDKETSTTTVSEPHNFAFVDCCELAVYIDTAEVPES